MNEAVSHSRPEPTRESGVLGTQPSVLPGSYEDGQKAGVQAWLRATRAPRVVGLIGILCAVAGEFIRYLARPVPALLFGPVIYLIAAAVIVAGLSKRLAPPPTGRQLADRQFVLGWRYAVTVVSGGRRRNAIIFAVLSAAMIFELLFASSALGKLGSWIAASGFLIVFVACLIYLGVFSRWWSPRTAALRLVADAPQI
ncbi:MAG: hypothetical protein QM779_13895 [Propionicimonas sp.]|uniref:hypothetical protein n=1 Tax=Propionicimonas sp. TaxID=1955623 RepID=UPI003D152B36